MSAKLKHLAIVSDQYLVRDFYEAMFGMKPSDNPPAGQSS
jgi:hypothetical protein